MPPNTVFEGTWEVVAEQAAQFAGKRVRLLVMEDLPEAAQRYLEFLADSAVTWTEPAYQASRNAHTQEISQALTLAEAWACQGGE